MATQDRPEEKPAEEDNDELIPLFEAYADAIEKEDVEAQEKVLLDVWQQMAHIKLEPSLWLQTTEAANQWAALGDWPKAEAAYMQATQVDDKPMIRYKAYEHLSDFYRLLGRKTEALEAAQQATELVRLENFPNLLSASLRSEARLYLESGDFHRAQITLAEALAVLEEGPMNHLGRCYALLLRADCFVQEGQLSSAQDDLETAWRLIEPHSKTQSFLGWQMPRAGWWSVKAKLYATQNDWHAAVSAWREVVELRRIITEFPLQEGPYKHNNLAVALQNLGRAQRLAGDGAASESFEESAAIRSRIGLPALEE